MRVVGMFAGIGTLLREARDAGLDVRGNVEIRPYFKNLDWIWGLNFPDVQLLTNFYGKKEKPKLPKLPDEWIEDADLMIGHPPCGSYSILGHSGRSLDKHSEEDRAQRVQERSKNPGLVPLFRRAVHRLRPRMFALENLPKLMELFPPSWWSENFPDYRITVMYITNWDYGSPQIRKRLWVVGTRSRRAFELKEPRRRLPGPENPLQALEGLPWEPWIDDHPLAHVHNEIDTRPRGGWWCLDDRGERYRLENVASVAMGFLSLPPGQIWPYYTAAMRPTKKPAQTRLFSTERHSRIPTGMETLRHPLTGWGLTLRERARLQGWPDDFHLWSENRGSLTRPMIYRMMVATGRAIPSEFPRYLIPQLIDHLRRNK